MTTGGVPILFIGPERYTAARAAFIIAQEREPVGYVKSSCEMPACVAPAHQTDRTMREARREAEREEAARLAAADVDEQAVELAVAGRLAETKLTPAEKRLAVSIAPPSMPVSILARRIGACSRTVKALRAELVGASS